MKRLSLLMLNLLLTLSIIAQEKSSGLLYEVISNDTKNYNNLFINLSPVYSEVYSPNTSFGIQLSGDYEYDNMLKFDLLYRKAYADRMSEVEPSMDIYNSAYMAMNAYCAEGTKSMSYLEFSGHYIFNLKKKKKKQRINLSSNRYTEVPWKYIESYSLNLGLSSYNYHAATSSESGDLFLYKGTRVASPSEEIVDIKGGSMVKMTTFNVGINRISKHSAEFKFNKGYGNKIIKASKTIYANLMFGISSEIKNVIVPEEVYLDEFGEVVSSDDYYEIKIQNSEFEVDTNTPVSKIGIRVGYKHYSLRVAGLSYGAEVGSRPGVGSFANNAYLNFNIGFNLSFLAK